ncbi:MULTISPECIES: hypothetical protein [Pseudomonas]|uniref:Sulfotransferase family protein n=5 Tax=Pseudomonas syringae group TaxID=136849 RepID=Q0EDY4_PSESF|nr:MULTISPECIES: hypothetical protein [Pseudomonas]EPN27948.1 hypothetical protein A259_01890 [Pseudomonas syringae pv. actinidiae ICMP 19070]KPB82618.1 Uncharacterized protein AC504_1246 [Pseudomonas syringae pv. maculicola]AAZ35592.1 hypothetical protein PSPPH_4318 [Pseudomonas savastanoi pv. phaseolicola 1448A]AAZ99798.1 Ptx2 [Pseudomonas savastanoi pv. phaseolicola]AQL39542.1 hypothetical protein JN853_26000 [Pseudomonas syringae pv. actinidiae ICMP 9853]
MTGRLLVRKNENTRLLLLKANEKKLRATILSLFPEEAVAIAGWTANRLPVGWVLSGPRCGTSAFKAALAKHPECLALAGEHRMFFTLNELNYPHTKANRESSLSTLDRKSKDDIKQMMLLLASCGDALVEPDSREVLRYAWEWAYRLPLQWTTTDFDPAVVVSAVQQATDIYLEGGTRDLSVLDGLVLDKLTTVYPTIDCAYYDLPGKSSASASHWSTYKEKNNGPIIEISPYVIPRPRQLKTASVNVKSLLLKASSDPFRISAMRSLFAEHEVRVVRLSRNPLSSINGLMDGWLHHCFWQHDLSTELGEDHPLSGWCFDLFEDWKQTAGSMSLVEVCSAQWLEPNKLIAQAVRSKAANEEWRDFKFEDFVRSENSQIDMLKNAAEFLFGTGDYFIVEQFVAPSVNVTEPHKPSRWQKRSEVLMPLLQSTQIIDLARAQGYEVEKLSDWI